MQIGLISDTHGLVRPQALAALAGSKLIIHAGDIGSPDVLDALGRIAPVYAVRGNVDRGDWARPLPTTEVVEVGRHSLYVLHELESLDLDPSAAGFTAVVYGHSHRPRVQRKGDVLYVNPGSAGPRRFSLPVAVARLTLNDDSLDCELVELALADA
jgi:putative phosphoesterase